MHEINKLPRQFVPEWNCIELLPTPLPHTPHGHITLATVTILLLI